MIDRDALEYLYDLGKQRHPIVKAPDFDVDGRFYIPLADGTMEEHHATIPPPSAEFFHTDPLVERVSVDCRDYQAKAAIFYAPDLITAELVDENDIRWRHKVHLPLHPAFQAVERLQQTSAFDQRGLVRFLRATLNGHVPETTVERFRALRVTTDGESNAVMTKGREAVDKRIAQRVLEQNGQDIPDEITATVPVYDLDEARSQLQSVTILVEPTAQEGTPLFELTAVLNSLRDARRDALSSIASNISMHLETYQLDEDVPVYHGRA